MENPEKISLQFELLNTYYSKIACKMSHTPKMKRRHIIGYTILLMEIAMIAAVLGCMFFFLR